jgi:peptidoglycan hydrolase CwlO-like protein
VVHRHIASTLTLGGTVLTVGNMEIVSIIITGILGYILGWKKNKAEVEGTQLDNLEKSIRIYQVLVTDLSSKVEELTAHVARLESQIDSLMKENKRLKSKKIIE